MEWLVLIAVILALWGIVRAISRYDDWSIARKIRPETPSFFNWRRPQPDIDKALSGMRSFSWGDVVWMLWAFLIFIPAIAIITARLGL